MSKFREFLTENPVVVGTGIVLLAMNFMDFEGNFQATAPESKTAEAKKGTSGKKYFDLFDDDEEYETPPGDQNDPNKQNPRSVASSGGVDSAPVAPDSIPTSPVNTFAETFSSEPSLTPELESTSEDDGGAVDDYDDPKILDSEEKLASSEEDTPGVNCLLTPNDPLCLSATSGGGGSSPSAASVAAVCDPNNPASECYEEPDLCTPGVMVNPRQGTYVKNPTVNIASTHSCVNDIKYCVKKGGGCCDPMGGGSYTAPFLVSDEDPGIQDNGAFCLSVVATGNNGDISPLYEYKFVVDDTTPDMVASFSSLLRIQSSEGSEYVQIDSSNFGLQGYTAYVINSFDESPTGLGKGCDEVVADYPPINHSVRSPAGVLVTPIGNLTPGVDTLKFYEFFENNMKFEKNYLTAFVTFTDPVGDQLHNCQQAPTPVEVWDFTAFSTVGVISDSSNVNSKGVSVFEGGFSDFGHFDGASSTVGTARSNAGGIADCGNGAGNCYLESGYLNVVN